MSDVPEMKELVMSMLALLAKNLERGIKRHRLVNDGGDSGASAENDGAMIGITGSMDRLGRLGLIIRASSKPDEVDRVLKFSRKGEPDGYDELIFALVKWRFPVDKMAESLQIQLASSIIYRRNRLRYNFRHEAKLSADREDGTDSETALTKLPGNAWQAARIAMGAQHEPGEPARPQHLDNKVPVAMAPAASNLLRQVLTHQVPRGLGKDGASSDASSSRSNNPFLSAEYPKPPTVPPNHSDAKCTICRKPQARRLLVDAKKWR
ncbi:hypothetical protein B0T24DRAFT_110496 [Lasiosphaeria ovina]|uniref:Uncharacterized protein n=1 Tax=Lasiosphaeria ovina TaxID=92902 RepID=A0AAE0MZN6_9PEZI|nr:hypothetical protein B0T24DRAFT_110496 [Lasiosphaeria ovina]